MTFPVSFFFWRGATILPFSNVLLAVCILGFILRTLHPGRLTWNIQITHLERKMIFPTSMIMFHVNLPGCKCKSSTQKESHKGVHLPIMIFSGANYLFGGPNTRNISPKNFPKINLFGYCNWAISGVGVPIFGIFGFFALFFAPRVRHGRKFVWPHWPMEA